MKQALKKIYKVFLPTVVGLFFFSTVASAHVTVVPKTSTTGAWETYTVKVPTEKAVPTTKFTVKTPAGVEIESYQPVPGWNYSAEKDASGKVKTFTFQTTGQGILPGQFQQFTFVAKNPAKTTKIAWDAYQYYKDGSIVEWTGDESAATPHSITDIVSSTPTNQANIQNSTQQNHPAKTTKTKATSNNSNTLALILSIVAVILAFIACILSFRKK